MKESDRTVPMLYERNDAYVIEAFRQGEFDYLEGVGEVSEADFFRAIAGKNILRKLAETYPSPCKKHEVPLWVYVASDLSMRFHGVHSFHAFPYVVRSGGMVQAFGPEMGHKGSIPKRGIFRWPVKGSTIRIHLIVRRRVTRITYARWPDGRNPNFYRTGSIGTWWGSSSNIMPLIPKGSSSEMPPICLCPTIRTMRTHR